MRANFTQSVIDSLPVGTHQDTKVTGLVCNVTEHSRRYGIYISVRNIPTRKSIGPVADWSVTAVRIEAQRIISALRESPKDKQRRTTLGQLVKLYTSHLEAEGRRTSDYAETDVRLSWAHLNDRQLDDITVMELAEVHNKIAKVRGKTAAKRAITTLRTLYHYASSLELTEKNPAKKVRVTPDRSREVYLTGEQLQVLRRVLKTMPTDAEDFFLLIILTGLRRSNVCGLHSDWLDLDEGICTVPAAKSKNGEEIVVALVPEAVEILRRRPEGYVFPSPKSASGHLMEPWFWLAEVREKMAELGVNAVSVRFEGFSTP